MATKWYFKTNDGERGPYRSNEIMELAANGKLKPDDPVRNEDNSDWFPAREIDAIGFGKGVTARSTQPSSVPVNGDQHTNAREQSRAENAPPDRTTLTISEKLSFAWSKVFPYLFLAASEAAKTATVCWSQLVRLIKWSISEVRFWLAKQREAKAIAHFGEELYRNEAGDSEIRRELQDIENQLSSKKVSWLTRWKLMCQQRTQLCHLAESATEESLHTGVIAQQLDQVRRSRVLIQKATVEQRRRLLPKKSREVLRVSLGLGLVLVLLFFLPPLIGRFDSESPHRDSFAGGSSTSSWSLGSSLTPEQIRRIEERHQTLQQRVLERETQLADAKATFQPDSTEFHRAVTNLDDARAQLLAIEDDYFQAQVAKCKNCQERLEEAQEEYQSLIETYLPTSDEARQKKDSIEALESEHDRYPHFVQYVATHGNFSPSSVEDWLRIAESATAHSNSDRDYYDKARSLEEIASLWLRHDDVSEAARIIETHDLKPDFAYTSIADKLNEWGDPGRAMQAAGLIDDEEKRLRVLMNVVNQAADQGDEKIAKRVLRETEDYVEQSDSWRLKVEMGRCFAKTNATDKALRMWQRAAEAVSSDDSRGALNVAYDLISVAEAQSEMGFFDDAEETIAMARALPNAGAATNRDCDKALADLAVRKYEAKQAQITSALTVVTTALTGYDRISARCRLAREVAKQHGKEQALAIVAETLALSKSDKFNRERRVAEMTSFTAYLRKERNEAVQRKNSGYAREVREIAAVMTELGAVEQAIALAKSIQGSDYKTANYKSEALTSIASVVATTEDKQLALELLVDAANVTGIKPSDFSWEPRTAIAMKQVDLGEVEAGLNTLERIELRGDRLQVLAAICAAYVKQGQLDAVRKLLIQYSRRSLETSAIAIGSARGLIPN